MSNIIYANNYSPHVCMKHIHIFTLNVRHSGTRNAPPSPHPPPLARPVGPIIGGGGEGEGRGES
jgi:hypothetical protein